ncbi:hypothetical protein PAJ34TS1_33480 [Paenibacillus azoreducens]|uniref:Uncharacterized protein n=1 Tax=Paenibacillus azoreducens TaxID=116718 RepID=A0A920CTQ8_9BACL|nr:hypothetical protein J34TS1_34070 [Paenibacillus azoreducens]
MGSNSIKLKTADFKGWVSAINKIPVVHEFMLDRGSSLNIELMKLLEGNAAKRILRSRYAVQRTAGWCEAVGIGFREVTSEQVCRNMYADTESNRYCGASLLDGD